MKPLELKNKNTVKPGVVSERCKLPVENVTETDR